MGSAYRHYGVKAWIYKALIVLFALVNITAHCATYLVKTNGTAGGTGASGNEWDLQTALKKTAVIVPGDIIYLRGGVYTHVPQETNCINGLPPCDDPGYNFQATIAGSVASKVIVRSYPGEYAILDGGAEVHYAACARPTLKIGSSGNTTLGANLRIQDIEFVSSSTETRQAGDDGSLPAAINRSEGIYAFAPGVEIVNCTFHDLATGVSSFGTAAVGQLFYGNVAYNNGWNGTLSPHGHGFYVQGPVAAGGLLQTMTRNMVAGSYQKSAQIYGSAAAEISHWRAGENLFVGVQGAHGGFLIGTRTGGAADRMQDNVATNNFGYGSDFSTFQLADTNAYHSLLAANNYFVKSKVQVSSWKTLTFTNNNFIDIVDIAFGNFSLVTNYGIFMPWNMDRNAYTFSSTGATMFCLEAVSNYSLTGWRTKTGYELNSTVTATLPSGTNLTVLYDNAYDTNRANAFAYNWRTDNFIAFDVSSLNWGTNAPVQIRNIQDPYFDVTTNLITSTNTLVLDFRLASHTVAIPYGAASAIISNTFPAFGAFLLQNLGTNAPAVPPVTVTLTVSSSNPASGVAILMSPADVNGASNGDTGFTRSVETNSVTTLTAPLAAASGETFSKWTLGGVDYTTSLITTFTNTANLTLNAVFLTPPSASLPGSVSSVVRRGFR